MTDQDFAPARVYRCAFCPAAGFASRDARESHEERAHGDVLAAIRRDAELSRAASGEDPK